MYQELENEEDVSNHFRMMGSAGKAIVYGLMSPEEFVGGSVEQEQKIRECLSKIGSQTDLLNDFMRRNIDEIQHRLNQPILTELDRS